MKPLLKVIASLFLFFGVIFVALRAADILTFTDIKQWLVDAKGLPPVYISLLVICLLLLDLLISVPTLALIILSGYLLGPKLAVLVCSLGLFTTGLAGYAVGFFFGERVLEKLLKSQQEREEMRMTFSRHAVVMILLSRALPMLPEVTSVLSGITSLPRWTFALAWLAANVPYVIVASVLGSFSTPENPTPALIGAPLLAATLWLGWLLFFTKTRRQP